nr:uncharacterized protein LOC109419389 [Aedes albopictus]XP_029733617.1 uncharacterized protein LOC109419389 [Aedes albopictus]XP_029733618.1 uncharacterized protein LOC109419389 [Aedes albopictus]XP_029733619.1 uncharacterized protein LOC109419389 [Aedes albopictus]
MNEVVECIKCICGCNELSRDRIKEILCKRIHGFLSDEAAVDMFKKFIPANSITHSDIANIQRAKKYLEMDIDTDSDELEEFAEDLEEHLEDELKTNSNTKEALERVIFEYSKKIESSKDYENFKANLREKYTSRPRRKT